MNSPACPRWKRWAGDIRALRSREADPQLSREQQEVESISGRLMLFKALLSGEVFLIVPRPAVSEPAAKRIVETGADRRPAHRMADAVRGGEDGLRSRAHRAGGRGPRETRSARIRRATGINSACTRGSCATRCARSIRSLYPADAALEREYAYNHLGAFPWASLLYGVGAVCLLVAAGWTAGARLQWAGLGVGFAGLVLHGVGIGLRSMVAGRPPVTNMYESMIWVAFVVTALGFVFFAHLPGHDLSAGRAARGLPVAVARPTTARGGAGHHRAVAPGAAG